MTAHEHRVAEMLAALTDRQPPTPPTHVVDQIAAATVDAERFARRLRESVAVADPARWCSPTATGDQDAAAAAWVRVMIGCATARWCPHLTGGGPQPAVARLALHRVDCSRCARTVRRPPPDEDSVCDWCHAPDVTQFSPIVVHVGALVGIGDACPDCATALHPWDSDQ